MARNPFYPSQKFFEFTTVHGPRHFLTRNSLSRCLWVLLVFSTFSFCCWQIQRTVVSYLAYGVKITKSIDELEIVDFPAITFCPASALKRLVVGSTPVIYQSSYTSSQPVPFDIQNADKLCRYDAAKKINATYDTTSLPPEFANYQQFYQKTFPDSFASVLGCKVASSKNSDCSSWFFNKFTILGRCFTFNQSPTVISSYPSAADDNHAVYGNTTGDIPIMTTGRNGGIQIHLTVNQSQYCIPVDQNTAGFVALVHDRLSEPVLHTDRLIDLPPGFATSVAIRMHKIERNTENWPTEKCYIKFPLHYYPKSDTYMYTDVAKWAMNCAVLNVVKSCQCYPLYNTPDTSIADNIAHQGFQYLCALNNNLQQCQWQVEKLIIGGKLCNPVVSSRPRPCRENLISVRVTSTVYPAANQFANEKKQLKTDNNMTKSEFRNNFLSANFYLQSFKVATVTVDPGMTWVDLMNQMGGAIGMSLGMSIVSLAEIFSWVIISLLNVSWRLTESHSATGISPYRP